MLENMNYVCLVWAEELILFSCLAGCTDTVYFYRLQCMAAIIFVPYSFCMLATLCRARMETWAQARAHQNQSPTIQRDYKRCKGALIRFILTVSAAVAVTWHVARLFSLPFSLSHTHSLSFAIWIVGSLACTSVTSFFLYAKWFYFSSILYHFF